MPTLTACPSCGGQLRVPDDLLGQPVRCPACQTTFDAAAPPRAPEPPAPARPVRPLEMDADKPAPPPAPRGLKGAVELKLPGDEEAALPPRPAGGPPPPPPPRPAPPPPRGPEPPRRDDRDVDWRRGRDPDVSYDRPGARDPDFRNREPRRLDTHPHRGSLILTLGVIALVLVIFCGVGPLVGIFLGLSAWVMGHRDLRKIKNREIDEEGLSSTQAGWICGIIAVILNTLVLFTCTGLLISFLLSVGNSGGSAPPKPPWGQESVEEKGK
jgi:predicted Zn finger-like uncharacterized protein